MPPRWRPVIDFPSYGHSDPYIQKGRMACTSLNRDAVRLSKTVVAEPVRLINGFGFRCIGVSAFYRLQRR